MQERPRNTPKILKEAERIHAESRYLHEEGTYTEVEQRLFRPLSDLADTELNVTNAELDEHDRRELAVFIRHLEERESQKGPYSHAENWHTAKQLEYTIGKSTFDMFHLLPDGYKILFCPKSELHAGAVNREKKIIFIADAVSSLGSLATLLHEIGHVKDFERLEKIKKFPFTEGGTPYENLQAETLRQEREASLFALRTLWREIRRDPQTKKDVLIFLKNMSYSSYCDEVLGKIAMRDSMGHHDPYGELDPTEYDETEQWDAWMKFRKSDEYPAWKQTDPFARLDKFEEFEAWCDWIQKTGKIDDAAFKKDIGNKTCLTYQNHLPISPAI